MKILVINGPLEASFHRVAFGGEEYAEIKKSVGVGTYVGLFEEVNHMPRIEEEKERLPSFSALGHDFQAMSACSIRKATGWGGRDRTCE